MENVCGSCIHSRYQAQTKASVSHPFTPENEVTGEIPRAQKGKVTLPQTSKVMVCYGIFVWLCTLLSLPLHVKVPATTCHNMHSRMHSKQLSLPVVLLAQPLWLGWPCAAPPPPLLRALRPIPFGVGVICDFLFSSFCCWLEAHDTPKPMVTLLPIR